MASLWSRDCRSGIADTRLCSRTSPQTQTVGDFGTVCLPAKPFVSGQRPAGRRLLRCEPFLDFHGAACCLFNDLLSDSNSARANRTKDSLWPLIRRICFAGAGILAPVVSGEIVR